MNIVLAHANCTDGMMSSFLMYLYFKEINQPTEFIFVKYNEPMPDVSGKHVFIVDFSYSPDQIHEASLVANSITMLDHHLTASEMWGGYCDFESTIEDNSELKCPIKVVIKEFQSGAGLVYEYLSSLYLKSNKYNTILINSRLRRLVMSVEDRDLWNFNLDGTKIIHEMLAIVPRTFEAWEELIINSSEEVFNIEYEKAKNYYDVKEQLAQDYAAMKQMVKINGEVIPIVNCPANFASRVCEIMAMDYPFALSYCLSTSYVYVSLRSNKKTGIDITPLAKKYLGGGHKNSGGFRLNMNQIVDLLQGKL